MIYTAFMVDIVDSKKLQKNDREDLQIYIKKVLENLNIVFGPELIFEVVFSAGDEVQGLFKTPTSAFMYYRLLRTLVSPLEIRCGIGVGTWDVKIINGTSSEQDGSAYHNAREAIDLAHKTFMGYNIIFNSESKNDIYINTLLNSSASFHQIQSDYQKQFNMLIEITQPFFDVEIMDIESLKEISQLIQKRLAINFYSESKNTKNIDMEQFQCEPLSIFNKSLYEGKIFLESTIKKGTSGKISNLINTTRQNTDKIIKSANIATIRNIELTALIYLHENFRR